MRPRWGREGIKRQEGVAKRLIRAYGTTTFTQAFPSSLLSDSR